MQLNTKLRKDPKIRCSDWEKYPLTDEQLQYAALDAYVSICLGTVSLTTSCSAYLWVVDTRIVTQPSLQHWNNFEVDLPFSLAFLW